MGYLFDDTVYFARQLAPYVLIVGNFIAILIIILTRKPKRNVQFAPKELSPHELRPHETSNAHPLQNKVVVG
jgi:hypothetical protein